MQRDASQIQAFLNGGPFAVVGASRDRKKYGNKVLRCYWEDDRTAYPVNPAATMVEGAPCYASLSALPVRPHAVSFITQPRVSVAAVEEACALGIEHLWFQPGAEHPQALAIAAAHGASVIAHGPCLLVVLRYRGG